MKRKRVSSLISELAIIWPKWNKLNAITINADIPARKRLSALRKQERLVQERYDLIQRIDDLINEKLAQRGNP